MNILSHKNNSKPIGFFDSGVGGLSVYSKFKTILPKENTLYFGDLANMPYGNKTQTQLIGFARKILDFYSTKNVKAVVIACNTSSAQAYEFIKNDYNFMIYPIIQSCAKVIASMNYSKIGIFATQATVNSQVYTKEINKYNNTIKTVEIACPDWVPIVETGNYTDNSSVKAIKQHVDTMIQFRPQKIILGCTHYPYLMPLLKQLVPEDIFIDPAEIFVDYIKTDLEQNDLLNSSSVFGQEEFFVSAKPDEFIKSASLFYTPPKYPILV